MGTQLTSAYGFSASIEKPSEAVAEANLAAAESLPFFPHSYELTPHWRRMRGTCMVTGKMGLRNKVCTSETVYLCY